MRRKTVDGQSNTKWRPTAKIPPYKKAPKPDPLATSQRQDHTGHGCSWDPLVTTRFDVKTKHVPLTRNYNQMRNDKRNVTAHRLPPEFEMSGIRPFRYTDRPGPLAASSTATGRVLNPKTGRMHKTSSAKAGDANTRVCPTCSAVVKGNAWHLNKHIARHK